MSGLRRIAAGAVVIVALGSAGRAAAEDPLARAQRRIDQARDLAQTARDVHDLLYYLSDPRGFEYDLYRTEEEVLADPILGPLARNLASLYTGRTWTATAQAQAMADSATPGSIAAGASLTWDMPLCRLFDAQISGQLFYEDGDPSAAMAWGVGGCLPLPFDTFELGYRGRRAVRTSLLATPILDGDRQSGDTVYSNIRFYRWLSPRHQIDVMPMSFNFDFAPADDGGTSLQALVNFAPVHWARRGRGYRGRDQTFDFVKLSISTLGVDNDGVSDPVVAVISPLAIDGVAIGDHVQVGVDVGWEMLDLYHGVEDLPSRRRTALHLDASVIGGAGGVTGEVHAKNVMTGTILNQILDEDRLTARVDVERDAAWVRVDGFLSHARLLDVDHFSERVWTYGAGADVTFAIVPRLFGYVRGEAARAIVVDPLAEHPETVRDLRGTVGVSTRLDRTW